MPTRSHGPHTLARIGAAWERARLVPLLVAAPAPAPPAPDAPEENGLEAELLSGACCRAAACHGRLLPPTGGWGTGRRAIWAESQRPVNRIDSLPMAWRNWCSLFLILSHFSVSPCGC
jgi:hypothetical protein